jgi:hypothetical protein
MYLSVNDGGHLGYPDASRPRKLDIISVPEIVGHGCVTFGSSWVKPSLNLELCDSV